MKIEVSVLLTLLLLSSCGSKSPGENVGDRTDALSTPVCEFTFDQGEAALDDHAGFQNMQAFDFGKRLNFADLEAVGDASALETVRYFETYLDVEVYRSNNELSGIGCTNNGLPFYNNLKIAPQGLLDVWNEVNGGGSEGRLLGLYKPSGNADIADYTDNSVIYVLPESARWTLLHEGMHHLFNRGRLRDGKSSDNQFWETFRPLASEYDTALTTLTYTSPTSNSFEGKLEKTVEVTQKAFSFMHEYMKRYTLEEATIEKILIEKTDSNEFTYIDGKARSGAIWYIQSSLEKAYELLSTLEKDLDTLDGYAKDASRDDLAQKLKDIRNSLDARISQVLVMYQWAENKKEKLGHASVRGKFARAPLHKDCNHHHPDEAKVLKFFKHR